METITFDKLLLKTAFCCMASDGNIDKKEIAQIKVLCKDSPLFNDFDFVKEINELVSKINKTVRNSFLTTLNYLKLLIYQKTKN